MIGRIDTGSLITLINRFFEKENSSDMDHLIPRIFQNSGGKPYVPAEVRDQTNTDAAELSHMIMTLPGLDLPLNETRASNNLAVIIPHIKTLNERIISMLPNEELRNVELFANKSDGELDGIRKSIAGGYVYNIAMKVALELKQRIGVDMNNMSDLNVMNMNKLVGAVVLNFPERIQAGGQNYQEMALKMLADLPGASPGKYDKTLQDCNIWTPAQKEMIENYSAMNPRERVKAITTKAIQEIDIKLILASADDSKEIDALHSKFQKANKDIYSERLHAPLFESAKIAIQPKVGKAKSDPAPRTSSPKVSDGGRRGSTGGIFNGLFRRKHNDSPESEKQALEDAASPQESAFPGIPLRTELPEQSTEKREESKAEISPSMQTMRQGFDDIVSGRSDSEGSKNEASEEEARKSPGMGRSSSGGEN